MFAKLMLIALVGVVSAEDAVVVAINNAPASAEVSCGTGLTGQDAIDQAVNGHAAPLTNEYLVTITHGRCKLELRPEHVYNGPDAMQSHSGVQATESHIFSVKGASATSGSSTNGYFETKYEDNVHPTETPTCDMDMHHNVSFAPVLANGAFTVLVTTTHLGDNAFSTDQTHYQTGFEFKQFYDDALLTGSGTNYGVNGDSWSQLYTSAEFVTSASHDITFDWASDCDAPVTPPPAPTGCDASCVAGVLTPLTTCPTDVTCQHAVDAALNPDGVIMATHTYTTHDKHRCWVDQTVTNFASDNTACKCMCIA